MPASRQAALALAEERRAALLEALKDLARVPGVSAEPPPSPALEQSAEVVARWMRRVGLEDVEVLRLEGTHPYVYGQWMHAPAEAPTVLLYAHHDVQPPGRASHWTSPPFEPTEREGRLYGRGVVDDKAGLAVHLGAIEAYLGSGGLPLNVKLIVEGEEEIGSEHLGAFLERYRDELAADVIVLTDTANLAAGLPSITVGLRGIVVADVEVCAVDHPLHSGMWGGPVPDAPIALAKILARLVDDQGRIGIPGLYERVRPMDNAARARLGALPFDEATFRAEAGMLASVHLAGESGYTPYELLWHRPSVTVQALEAAPIQGSSNQILPSARARVSLRIVPDIDPGEAGRALARLLEADPPWGVEVRTTLHAAAGWWTTTPAGPAFAAAERALEQGFGRRPVYIGCGGTIPFVGPFARVLGGVPAVLIGLEDPLCNAHSENESLLLSDFDKATRSAIHLYDELARALAR
jgi:acetylornithine deacetylase/succinyl-diaminopimelate desuccinylase-like protein